MTQTVTAKPAKVKKQPLWPYIRLQLKLAFKNDKIQKKSTKIIGWVVKVLLFALALFFAFLFVKQLVSQSKIIPGPSISIALFTIFQIILLIYCVSIQTKRLYKPNDLRIISVLPYSTFQKYVGEIIAIFLRVSIYSGVIFYPLLLMYGWGANIISVGFVFSALLATAVLPLLPFAVSLLICVPFMYLGEFLRNKNIVKLIIFIVLFVALLVLYSFILKFMADWYIHSKNNKEVMQGIANFLAALNGPYNFCYFTSEICLGNKIYINLPIILGISAAIGAAGIAITRPLYNKFMTQGVIEGEAIIKHAKIDNIPTYRAIFVKEIKQILRTPAYAYFYLGVAFSMPILTYLVTNVVKNIGAAQVGSQEFFGFGLLIILIIISLVGSYSANVISREGKQFYITKVSPLSYRKQMLAKLLVNFAVAFIGLVLCIVVLAATSMTNTKTMPGLDWQGLGFLILISVLFLVGLTFNGANIDLVRPKIDMLGGQENDSNIVINLLIGLVLTAAAAICAITLGTINTQATLFVQLGIVGGALLYAGINFLVWFFTCEKKYIKMEIK